MKNNPNFDNNQYVYSERYIDTPNNFVKENFLYVQETGYLKSLKAHTSQRDKMNSYLIIYVVTGEGYFTYRSKTTKVTKGACFYVDCNESYAHESIEENRWELLWIHFNGNQAEAYYNYFIRQNSNIFYPEDQSQIEIQFNQIIETTKNKQNHYEIINNSHIIQLITDIIQTKKASISASKSDNLSVKLEKIRDYIHDNFTKVITLDSLSEQFLISKYYLSREFKHKYNIGIVTYLTNRRITFAKQLLRFTNKSVNDIAREVGIDDTTYFIKQFKKIENITPAEYRNKW